MNSAEELRRTIKEEIVTFLEAPLDYPQGFKSWLISYLSASNLRLPRSSVNGLYTVGDSIAGLGEPAHGRPCMVRLGSSAPYDWVQMTYDDIAGLWVSTQVWTGFIIGSGIQSGSGTYADAASNQWTPFQVSSITKAVTAGLRAQVLVTAQATLVGASEVGYLRAAVYEVNDGDTSLSLVGTGGEVSTGTNNAFKTSGWSDVTWSTTPTEAIGIVIPQVKHDFGSVTWASVNVAYRWVADRA